jgi:hypothetical protein
VAVGALKFDRRILGGVACLLVVAVGCGDGRPTRVPVSGRVLIDGKPLAKGLVRFVPQGARPSSGKLDESGQFRLTCYDGSDGAVLGKHRVQVTASEILGGEKVVWHAPRKYADFRSSGIEFDVTEPTDEIVIELSWAGEQRPPNAR